MAKASKVDFTRQGEDILYTEVMKLDEFNIHDVQIKILKELLFKPGARFRELNVIGLSSDHFSFHVNKLVEVGLIIKEDQRYSLTAGGKEFANRMDTESLKIERQAKLGCLICAVRKKGVATEYLLQKRLKEPYFGFFGLVGGKIRWGETAKGAAEREFIEETGFTGHLTFKGVEHKMDLSSKGELLEDKYFMIFRADNTEGEFKEEIEGGENHWFTKKEVEKIKFLFDDVLLIIDMINRDGMSFHENSFTVQSY